MCELWETQGLWLVDCLVLMCHGPSGMWALDLSNPVLRIPGRDHGIDSVWATSFPLDVGMGLSLGLGWGWPVVVLLVHCKDMGVLARAAADMQHQPFISTRLISLSVKLTTEV